MAKSIQMNNGTEQLYPVSSVFVDISAQCTKIGSGDCTARVFCDRVNKIVYGSVSVYNATAFDTGTAIITIPSGYRPKSSFVFPMVCRNSSGTYCVKGTVNASTGAVTQTFTSSALDAYGTFEYQI